MKIGMRTIKTALCATIGIMLAQGLGLLYPTAAGIIALLSVTNTKRSAFKVGFYRLCSLALATGIAYLSFSLIGYNPIAFGIYLLFFIPLAARGKMSEGIPVSSVLVTHYYLEESLSLALIGNAFMLLLIGVGLALLANLYMPDISAKLTKNQAKIDTMIRALLIEMSTYFNGENVVSNCDNLLQDLTTLLNEAEGYAQRHDENQLLTTDIYFLEYFTMRRMQVNVLAKMQEIIRQIDPSQSNITEVANLLNLAGETFSESNDGQDLKANIAETLARYRQAELPQSRLEFENRARLYQLLNEFEHFIEIKIDFSASKLFQ